LDTLIKFPEAIKKVKYMFDSSNDLFGAQELKIEEETQVIFVADYFIEDINGGAELTTEALIKKSPLPVQKIKTDQLTLKLLEEGQDCFWVFCNYAGMTPDLIPTIVTNLRYSIVEYDYKFCTFRSLERHKEETGSECNCHDEGIGKLVSAFMYGAKSLWFMSEKQLEIYETRFPFLREVSSTVLSSTFSDEAFAAITALRDKTKDQKSNQWLVLGSTSWIKGTQEAIDWCNQNNKDFEIIQNLNHAQCLEKLSTAEGLVFLPRGGDTCPRIVIEAKLLGCELHLNEHVQHKDEEWFNTDDLLTIESYLYAARDVFWNGILNDINWTPTISGYTTTKDCIDNQYPWEQSIKSMLGFCDEVIVMDGGSKDETYSKLLDWAQDEEKLKVYQVKRDWSHPRFAVFDGAQKALARTKCTMDFCWQMDADEVVHEEDYQKIKSLAKKFPGQVDLVSLPVIEYWGSKDKVRMDVTPWKWRISRNMPQVTHGIPKELRLKDENERVYAKLGTDGCDYINFENYERIPHASFYTGEVENIRSAALSGNSEAKKNYETWFNRAVEMLPSVHHYSWIDIPRKIRTYKNYWSQHWQSLYDIKQEDISENNMFFDKSWSEVTDAEIDKLGSKLSKEMGGWIFHSKVDFNLKTPHIVVDRSQPKVMEKE
jgi:glycosyltransferase involved in cell wall biosynthesis